MALDATPVSSVTPGGTQHAGTGGWLCLLWAALEKHTRLVTRRRARDTKAETCEFHAWNFQSLALLFEFVCPQKLQDRYAGYCKL